MNLVVLVGRLARDPEIRYTGNQTAVCSATIAVDRVPRQGQTREEAGADFIRLTVFGKQGETFQRFLTKGRQVAVQGRLNTGSYVNKDGVTVYTTDVIVDRFDFIGGRNDGGQQGGFTRPQGMDMDMGSPASSAPAAGGSIPTEMPDGFEAMDDDEIPF